MLKRHLPLIIAGTLLMLLSGFFYYLYQKSPTINWGRNYSYNSSSPYGNELLYKLLRGLYKDQDFSRIEESLVYNSEFKEDFSGKSIYFFSGETFNPDKSNIGQIKNFVDRGNQVFIAADGVSQYFLDSLIQSNKSSNSRNENAFTQIECLKIEPNFLHPDLKINKPISVSFEMFMVPVPSAMSYLSQDFFEKLTLNSSATPYYKIGYFKILNTDSFINYVKIKVGKGWLHLYSTPLVLTNYHLRNKAVFNYAQSIFLHLEPGHIYWHVNGFQSMDIEEMPEQQGKSPFGVFLSYEALRYAWYTFLSAILLFCLFNFKRKQRAIPVLKKNTNSSIEFAETISKLYLADGRHKNIVIQKYRYFFNYVKTRYAINLKLDKAEDKNRLAILSKIPLSTINQIMINYTIIQSLPDTKADELFESVRLINEFYEKNT